MNEYLEKKLKHYESELDKARQEYIKLSIITQQIEGAIIAIKEMLNENKAKCQTEEAETPH